MASRKPTSSEIQAMRLELASVVREFTEAGFSSIDPTSKLSPQDRVWHRAVEAIIECHNKFKTTVKRAELEALFGKSVEALKTLLASHQPQAAAEQEQDADSDRASSIVRFSNANPHFCNIDRRPYRRPPRLDCSQQEEALRPTYPVQLQRLIQGTIVLMCRSAGLSTGVEQTSMENEARVRQYKEWTEQRSLHEKHDF